MKKWYVVYTRARWEKKVFRLLVEKGFDSYCPLNKVYRKWSDRMKIVEEPLFKSYVFVKVTPEQQSEIRRTAGVINFVYWLGKPAIVKEKEVERIKLFLQDHEDVEVVNLAPGQNIKIRSGVFSGQEAKVELVKKNYVVVIIKSLNYQLRARIKHSGMQIDLL